MLITQQVGLSGSRPIPPLNRKKLKYGGLIEGRNETECSQLSNQTFSLKSGRVIRQVNGAPVLHKRNWVLPAPVLPNAKNSPQKKLDGYPLLGEVIMSI